MRRLARVAALAALLAIAGLQPAFATDAAPTSTPKIAGRWKGARLRCQKEEGKLVRCGTPMPFEIRLDDSGTGTTTDESLPKDFAWRWTSATEIAVTPVGGGPEIKLFSVQKEDEDTLSFQAYFYLPTVDPNASAKTRYLHFIFDVTRAD